MLIHKMQALELMKTHVVKTTPEDSLRNALDLMDLYQVDGLPVVDATGRLCGMLTEQDVWNVFLKDIVLDTEAQSLIEHLNNLAPIGNRSVREVMTTEVISISEKADVRNAAILLVRSGRKRLPVTNAEGQVVGTFNRVDVCQAIFEGIL
jgi:CBS domain-containing protein